MPHVSEPQTCAQTHLRKALYHTRSVAESYVKYDYSFDIVIEYFFVRFFEVHDGFVILQLPDVLDF